MEIFSTLLLSNGDSCEVLMVKGFMISKANYKHGLQKEYDVIPFIMAECCNINGSFKELEYFLKLSVEDYQLITEYIEAAVFKLN